MKDRPGRRSKKFQIISIGLLVAGVIVGGGSVLLRKREARLLEAQQQSRTVEVKRESLSVRTEASGVVVAVRRINISPASPGRIQKLMLREGDQVRAGELLAVMENDEAQSRVKQLEAALEGANAEKEADSRRLERFERLLRDGAVSPDQVDELRKNVTRSIANVDETRAQLREAKSLLERSYIRAPFSGIITQLFAEVSEYVAPATSASSGAGATSTTIAELSRGLEVEAKIPESNLLNIKAGQRAKIESDAFPGEEFNGEVISVSPRAVASDNVITFPVTVRLLDGYSRLRPEMNVRVRFLGDDIKDALTVPLAAVETLKDGSTIVQVRTSDGKSETRTIQLGAVSGSQVQVVRGLNAGEKIFLTPLQGNQETQEGG
jgi:HlyD family secretion protein